ncbi:hypothetical protein SAMN05421829_12018 [Aromatoleum tolulyticum]|uniref:Secretion system X translation initiation factor n=1 Tax=Aromatoleum tolulyticum TaxID=34027 RepID=A0A1N7BWK4_9RHOO|nr:secretion system X translation initiation factor [Aromatoleum tolulyticum]SIR55700.1 hypothetical protein SAMN05421829_12018 [Aromatoleum tolulyticum]
MAKRRGLFWVVFLGAAAVLAIAPEFFDSPVAEPVQPAARPRPAASAPAPAPVALSGQLAELRSAAAPAGTPSAPVHGEAAAPSAPDAAPAAQAAPPAPADAAPRPAPELFTAHSWYVPPPPPPPPPPAPPPPPPPAPTAPPIPYEYLGKLADGHSVRVFLVRGERPYTVIEGDVLDGSYKVKSITDTTMTFVYLPLNITQTLPVGSKP